MHDYALIRKTAIKVAGVVGLLVAAGAVIFKH